MEQTVQSIIDTIMTSQREGFSGGKLKAPKSTLYLMVPSRNISLSELRRLKRQFLQMNNFYTQTELERVANSFVEYLNMNF